jgi:acyl-homoserine lactone acylase PvdQ
MTDLLDAATNVTVDQAIALAFDTQVYHAHLWQARLKQAWSQAPDSARNGDAAELFSLIEKWNGRSGPDSEGALAYYAFKKGLGENLAREVDPPSSLKDEQLLGALNRAVEWLRTHFGSVRVSYGTYFRVGRDGGERTWPVGGGSLRDTGMATARAISFHRRGQQMVGRGGQTSTQIVVLSDPPQSFTVVPLGVSDHRQSPHWDDQAEKLFSRGTAAPTYFLQRDELMKHVTAKKVLQREVKRALKGVE